MPSKKTILITGASGFVGQRFLEYNAEKYKIKTVSLRSTSPEDVDFSDVESVVHLAGMAHQMQKIDPQIYFDVNTELTRRLVNAAIIAGVPHFVFVSTIKVFGEHQDSLLKLDSPCVPVNDPYGESKLEAEQYLKTIDKNKISIATLRPPLIYGPRVKGNLIRFLKLGDLPFPLPFAGIENRRTMVFLDNFIELINKVVDNKATGTFLAGDQRPISTTELIREIRLGLGKNPNLFRMPGFMQSILKSLKPELFIRLFGSLEMETSTSNKSINFTPPYSIQDGIRSMVDWYKNDVKN